MSNLCQIFILSERVRVYQELSTCPTVPYLQPFLRDMVAFLENVRTQPFECHVRCDMAFQQSSYQYVPEHNVGVICLQIYQDIRIFPHLLAHELCHYIMDNQMAFHKQGLSNKLSSYEEVFAEVFTLFMLKKEVKWLSQKSDIYTVQAAREYLQGLYQRVRSQYQTLCQEGIEAIPLLESNFLPDYDNCSAVAHFLLPYFEENPELWNILLHVQDVNPLAPWSEFWAYIHTKADDSYRESLEKLIAKLYP